MVLNPVVFKSLPYNAKKDFASIGMVGISPLIVVVNKDPKANMPGELIALAKAEPGAANR